MLAYCASVVMNAVPAGINNSASFGIAEYFRTSLAVPFVTVYNTRSPVDPQNFRATDSSVVVLVNAHHT